MSERFVGDVTIVDSQGRLAFQFDADEHRFYGFDEKGRRVLTFFGRNAQLYVGGEGNEGDLYLVDDADRNFVHFDSGSHRLHLNDDAGQDFLRFEATDHRFYGFDEAGRRVLTFFGRNAQLYVGGEGNEGDLYIVHPNGVNTIQLDGNSGDIILRSADAAEEFDAVDGEDIDPGSVVVLDDGGAVRPCSQPYDSRVAGIVSGAGEYRPGLVFDRHDDTSRVPVAMMGKVFCMADAGPAPIGTGDLLTTSSTLGHAMRAIEPARTTGAVVGKALGPLSEGFGLVPVLTALQ